MRFFFYYSWTEISGDNLTEEDYNHESENFDILKYDERFNCVI